jgi:hypothetical protein
VEEVHALEEPDDTVRAGVEALRALVGMLIRFQASHLKLAEKAYDPESGNPRGVGSGGFTVEILAECFASRARRKPGSSLEGGLWARKLEGGLCGPRLQDGYSADPRCASSSSSPIYMGSKSDLVVQFLDVAQKPILQACVSALSYLCHGRVQILNTTALSLQASTAGSFVISGVWSVVRMLLCTIQRRRTR